MKKLLLPKKQLALPGLKSPLAGYRGGKFLLRERLIAKMPDHQCYCEPFCGAAWVFFGKTPSPVEVLNDINGDIINFFEVIRDNWQGFDSRCNAFLLKSRRLFESCRNLPQHRLPALERAFRFWYLLKQSFGGDLHLVHRAGKPCYSATYGYMRKSSHNKKSWKNFDRTYPGERLKEPSLRQIKAWHRRLRHVNLEQGDWRDILARYDGKGTFFFLDPPYLGTEKCYGSQHFHKDDFEELASICRRLAGKFLLTINDHADIRALFASFKIEKYTNYYSVNPASQKAHGELFITNY